MDRQFRQALRIWHTEPTDEAQERVIALAFRQGMDIWDIFRLVLNWEDDIPLHQAVREALPQNVRIEGPGAAVNSALDLLGDRIAPLEENAFSSGTWSTGEDDEYGHSLYVSGKEYRIGYIDRETPGEAYILEDVVAGYEPMGGNIYHHDKISHSITEVDDIDIINAVRDQNMQDLLINVARWHIAKQAAGGNEILARILVMNIQYNSGEMDEPTLLDDPEDPESYIEFWKVGRNATHGFYLGYKGGQRYRMSEYWDWDGEESHLDQNITPVDDFSGYIGHF